MSASRKEVFVIQSLTRVGDVVFRLIAEAAEAAGVAIFRLDEVAAGTSFATALKHAIEKAPLLIADISDANPNVMYEVGLAQAQQKPIIFLASSARPIPFNLASARVLVYDLTEPDDFVDRLKSALVEALETPYPFTPEGARQEAEKRPNVFISYSHKDREYLSRLLVHLKPLERDNLIDLWVDTRLRAGDRWKSEIKKALERATVAILLVSADFLASDFITENELPPLLRDAESKGTRIIPLIVKSCRFTRDRNLRHFQALNDLEGPLVLLPPGDQEVVYDSLAAEVERLLPKG